MSALNDSLHTNVIVSINFAGRVNSHRGRNSMQFCSFNTSTEATVIRCFVYSGAQRNNGRERTERRSSKCVVVAVDIIIRLSSP